VVELKKANTKQLKAAATLYNKKIAEEKRVAREEAKVVRDQEKAKKAAATVAKKAAQNIRKTLPTAQSGKHKASQACQPKAKHARRSGGGAAADGSTPPVVAAPPKLNSHGRAINVPAKYR
jgi:rubrerythrin